MTKSITQKTTTKQAHNLNNYLLSCANQTKYLTCLLILLFSSMGWGQVNYSQTWASTGLNSWTSQNGGFSRTTSSICGTTGSIRANLYSTNSTGNFYSPSLSGNTGGLITMSYQYKIINYTGGAATPNNFGTLKVQYSSDLVTWTDISGSTISTNHVASTSCTTKTVTFTPTSGTLYVRFNVVWSVGDYYIYFDDVSISQAAPTPCSGTPTAGTISTANQYLCSGSTVPNLVNTGFSSGVTGITFQWQQSTDDSNWINVTTGTGATTATYTPPVFAGTTIYYRCNVTCANGGGTAATPSVSINPPANPSTQVTNAVASAINYTSFTTTWVNGNGNRRVVYISTAPIVEPSNGTGAAAHTVNTVYAGSGQQIVFDGTGTSVAVTGLALGTTYYVKVFEYSRCGTTTFDYYYNLTSGTNAISVTTISPTSVPWNEGFAVGGNLTNWLATSDFFVGSSIAALNPALATNYMYVNLYDYYDYYDDHYLNTTANFSTPIFAALPANYRLVFDYKINNFGLTTAPGAGTGNIVVAISTNNGSTFTTLQTINNNGVTGWQNIAIDLSSYAGQNIRLMFTANETTTEIDYYVGFDNFSVEATPSCLPPNTLVLSSFTNNSASLSWTASASAPGSGYEVYYSTTNTAPVTGTTASASVASGTTYAFTGLTASTTYYSWVRSNCGSGDVSVWVASASFTTQCNPVSVPYSQDFESVTIPALPICTSIENAGTGNNWKTASPAGYGFTTKCLNYSYNGDNAANAWFFTAGINLTAGTSYRISYNYGTPSTTYFPENLKVAYGVSASSASMTTVLATHTNILTNLAPLSTVDFIPSTTGVYYFGFNAFSDADMDQLYVDNISIKVTPNTWTGNTSNSWNTASNWSLNTVPTASDDILISSNGSNPPVMDVDVTIPAGKSLRINSSGTLTIAPGKVLTIAGTANFNGKAVTFKSDATGTAMLGPLTGSLTNATNVKVERYIPSGKRAFRLLSPAVTTTTFISGNWQGQTHITGGASGGFDVTETNNPSMFTYNNLAPSGTGWTPIANTNNTNLTAGVGYRMLVRGNRNVNLTVASQDNMNAAITLSATGTLRTGTVTLDATSTPSINNTTNSVTDGFSLVGNPYQSAVDWHLVTRTGIQDTYWAWDTNMGTPGVQRGRYVAYNVSSGSVVVVDGVGSSNVNQFIQPGQAFFVKNTGSGAGTLTFEEADKATTSANVFRTANTPSLGVALYDPNELAIGGYPIDATKAVFSSEYTNELGLGDATKLEAAGENIAWFRNNTKLAIDAAAPVTTSDELVMKTIRLGANKNYTFKIQTTNFDTALTPYLVDTFLNTQTEIATSQAYLATFATTSNVASYSENRFKIVFQNALLSTDTFATQVGLYPNPSKGNGFYLQLPATTQATVRLYNTLGQEIAISHNEGHYQANQSLAAGVYHIMVTQGEKTSKLKWIVE